MWKVHHFSLLKSESVTTDKLNALKLCSIGTKSHRTSGSLTQLFSKNHDMKYWITRLFYSLSLCHPWDGITVLFHCLRLLTMRARWCRPLWLISYIFNMKHQTYSNLLKKYVSGNLTCLVNGLKLHVGC